MEPRAGSFLLAAIETMHKYGVHSLEDATSFLALYKTRKLENAETPDKTTLEASQEQQKTEA